MPSRMQSLRKKIDLIDSQLLKLLNERAGCTQEIGAIKNRAGKRAYVPERESEVYRRLLEMNKGPLNKKAIIAIYREIMSASIALEQPMTVAYLGPEWSFTHLASLKKFGDAVEYRECQTIGEVFVEVEKGRSHHGVVPIENSTEGAVNHSYDLFMESDLQICSELFMDIRHNLMSTGALSSIKKIYSKAEVFGQCRAWLEAHAPHVELVPVSSTSLGAEMASREKGTGAIASDLAARHYKLKIVARSIEDLNDNVTRFLVIGTESASRTRRAKTSLMFSVKDKIGALQEMLAPFKRNGLNLVKIESRPSRRRAWEYYFFVDLVGHQADPKVKKAIDELQKYCTYLKVLGSYPTAP
ncbi:MAG: prephenate dehydratase [Candidatus Omnitrophica bacterium]|nr:prephenate dehydratase [Candidatus Omnitrophota bacterium]